MAKERNKQKQRQQLQDEFAQELNLEDEAQQALKDAIENKTSIEKIANYDFPQNRMEVIVESEG